MLQPQRSTLKSPHLTRHLTPAWTVPRVMECGYCLIGGIKFVEFMCQNVGLSAGKFCIIPKDQWPAWNIRVKNSPQVLGMIMILSQRGGEKKQHFFVSPVQSLAKTYFSEKLPFAVSPSLFVLQPGETVVVEVSLNVLFLFICLF